MATVIHGPAEGPPGSAGTPVETWERLAAWWRGRRDRLHERYPWVGRLRPWLLWAALLLLLTMALVFPPYRDSLSVYASCLWLLVLWFAAARTKTVSWSSVARLFGVCLMWSWVIAWASFRLAASVDLEVDAAGPGTAIAAVTEESLKLVPLLVLAVAAPGRVRRFAAVDWLLLGLVAGLAFQAWEELLRRLVTQVTRPGILDYIVGTGPGSGYPQYGWGLLSGGSGRWSGDEVWGYAGHHVFTALTTTAVGLAVAMWRHAGRVAPSPHSTGNPTTRLGWHVGAVALVAAVWAITVVDHFGYNASLRDPQWLDGAEPAAPWPLRFLWEHLGQGTGRGWLLLAMFVVAMLVDSSRLHSAGRLTDLPGPLTDRQVTGTGGHAGWLVRPRTAVDRWVASGLPAGLPAGPGGARRVVRIAATAGVALAAHAGRDVAMIILAHAREEAEPRRAAIARGRATAVMLRQLRGDAMAADAGRSPVAGVAVAPQEEVARRRRVRLLAGILLIVVVLLGTLVAASLARRIGTDLTPGGELPGWLAGQFESLGEWWDARSTGEKVLIGAGIAALVALSGGSLTLAFGLSGAVTYLAEHGQGAAAFTRDPAAATRSWLSTTTPAGAALDLLEFGLTFAPGNFAGAATGRLARGLAREYADDPAAFWARRRAQLADDRGSVQFPGRDPFVLDPADLDALTDYTGPGFRELNPRLRADVPMDAQVMARVDAVSRALGKLPPMRGTVYRGTQLTAEQIARYEPGVLVREAAFTSATADPGRAFRGNVRFVIESVTGRDVSPYSQFPRQAEVLFDHGTAFRVLGRDVDPVTGSVEIFLREVPQ